MFFSCCDSVAAHFKHAATRQPRRKPTVETCVHNTAKLRPQASSLALRAAGANQLLKHGHVHATHNERCRGQRPVHHHQVHAWRRGHWPGHHDQAPATHNERRRGKQPGRNDEVPAMHNERRREQFPEHNAIPSCSAASFEEKLRAPHTPGHVPRTVCVWGPSLLAVFIYLADCSNKDREPSKWMF
jgi:hypothetical protein